MTTIIISDIHNRIDWIEPALSSPLLEPYDRVIFLGDYFDDFNDGPAKVSKAAKWLKKSLHEPGRIHLIGTHDIWYRFPDNPFVRASGNTKEKSIAINNILTAKDWNLLKPFHYEQNFLLTHAGLHRRLITKYLLNNKLDIKGDISKIIDRIDIIMKPAIENALKEISNNRPNEWFDAGFARGGMQEAGGITWLDWNLEFEPVEGLNQIVGHTQLSYPEDHNAKNSKNYCMDTRNRHIGILKNGIFSYVKTEEILHSTKI